MSSFILKTHKSANPSNNLAKLKKECPMPVLLRHLGLGAYAKESCRSPFRTDKNASWGIYEGKEGWRYKDHGTGESGDEIGILANHLNIDERENFSLLLAVYEEINRCCDHELGKETPQSAAKKTNQERPRLEGFSKGTPAQLLSLSDLRIISVDALNTASEAGTLVFGIWHQQEVYCVTDKSGRIHELRRLDGNKFPAVGDLPERKSHAIKHSDKSWPVGLLEAVKKPNIILTEGGPDFLAAYDLIQAEGKQEAWAPISLLSANVLIADDALPQFKDKNVLIIPHADDSHAGMKAATRWMEQLSKAGAKVTIFDTSAAKKATENVVSDLNELVAYRTVQQGEEEEWLKSILS